MKKLFIITVAGCLLMSASAYAQNETAGAIDSYKENAESGVAGIEQIITEGQEMLASARSESNVSQMDCINSQLIVARGFLNVAQNALTNLNEAISRNDEAAAAHHQKLLNLAIDKAEAVSSQLKQCRSGVISVSGETSTSHARKCKVEPCLDNEEEGNIHTEHKIVDASPYI